MTTGLQAGCSLSLLALCLGLAPPADQAAGRIEWRSGIAQVAPRTGPEIAEVVSAASLQEKGQHVVVLFAEPVTPDDRAELAAAGVILQSYLGGNTFFALVKGQTADPEAVAAHRTLNAVLPIERNWKLHPDLVNDIVHPWAIVDTKQGAKEGEVIPGDPTVGAYIMFHRDVDLDMIGAPLVQRFGGRIRSNLRSINGLVIELPMSMIKPLAAEDAVQWIEPPLPKMDVVNNDNRARTGADIVNAPPYGLDGSGVSVLVYDGGFGLASHSDFGGRLTVRDASGLSDHSTHVAGTIGGDGTGSAGLYRGMAPGVTIESYGFEQPGGLQQGFLYTDPGDLEADYSEAINTFGAHIANNSIGTNTAPNGFPCDWEGNYGVTSNLIDTVVRGDGSNALFTAPFRIVWANGNERQVSTCFGIEGFPGEYHSTAPPACAKNHITVGALNSNDDSVTSFTSWGPADDGRLKPDISAPGCQSNDDNGVTSTSSSGAYSVKCGTSMASPTVCGLGALLLQDFRAQNPTEPDFRNSTLKVFLAHSAVDIANTGPDYQTGYGSVRIQAAVDLMRSGNFLENTVNQGEVFAALVVVNPGDPPLKVTLAWDDVPGTPNVDPALVNDLDLRVFDMSNTQYFPWTLDPAVPSAPAVRTQADHVNNIEQVVIDAPAPGVYRIEVFAFNVPSGPQPFSLAATPLLVNCSSTGVIALDRPKYPCESTATIRVVDCDLNTDDLIVETVDVTIVSDSEPAGETVTLTESGAETATFLATITLSETDAASVLLVSAGDSVTTTYIDADDGQGGNNVVVNASAVIDCTDPVISNVQSTNIQPRSASVTFDTDEPAGGVVRFGLSCAALTGTANESGFKTSHTLNLSGLTDNTTYFYAVDATDEAGNSATDDNGGSCYSFTTPEIPDFFTEEFGGDNDLDNVSLLFAPNGSFDFYAGCADPIIALPTDPTGGTGLTLSDDGSATLNLTTPVSLYGTSYSTIFVNANGNITFTSSDGTYTESTSLHFGQPRVSALFDDLNPSAGGTVSWQELADRVVVTFQNVPEFSTTNSNTFQIELLFDGTVRVSYLDIAAGDGIAGLSEGNGLSPDFFETDLTAMGSCGPRPPNASNAAVTTPIDVPINITLQAGDDGLPDPPAALTYIITSLPNHTLRDLSDSHGIVPGDLPYTLVGGGNMVRYEPNGGINEADSFQFKANDGGISPDGGDSGIAMVSITVGGPQIIYQFPMDSDPAWTPQNAWAFGQPAGLQGDPAAGFTGTNVYGYNLNGNYTDGMPETYLTTAALDCSQLSQVELRFWKWLCMESSTFDNASVRVSNDGTNWTTLWSHTGGSFSDTSWSQMVFDISSVADGQPTVFVRWVMGTTDGSVTFCGWNIDDVELFAIPMNPLFGDFDGDGDVDLDDYKAFASCLTGPDNGPVATGCEVLDFESDGDVDIKDFSKFQLSFTN